MIQDSNDIPQSWRHVLGGIKLLAPSAVLAGGALRDRDNGRPVKDLDVFVCGEGEADLYALHAVLTEAGYVCAAIDPEKAYPVDEGGEVVGLFDVRDPLMDIYGVPDGVQLIMVRWNTAEIVRRFDFGICQIAFDGEKVTRSAAYGQDQQAQTFTIVRERSGEMLEASVERFARLTAKYPGWRFRLGEALGPSCDCFAAY